MSKSDLPGVGTVAGGAGAERPRRGCWAAPRHARSSGFTLIEIFVVLAIGGVLAVLAVGQYTQYIDSARVATAKADIAMISHDLLRYFNAHQAYPASLADVGRGAMLDPWGRPYHYTDLTGKSKGKARKDRKLNPLNSDFDLFSAGKDGVFKPQISQKDSLDDVIRARDGAFVDLAEKF